MIVPDSKVLKIAPRENQRPEVLIDSLEQGFRRGHPNARRVDTLIAAIAVDAVILSDPASAGAAKGLDSEDVAFFHSLIGLGFDEGDLLVAVDLVVQDVVAGQATDGFDREGFAFEFYFVAFHCFLDDGADVVDAGVDAGFL